MIASDATLDRFLAARMAFIVRCDWLITSHKPRQRDAVGAPSCTRIAHDLAPNEMEQDGLIGIGDVGGGASSSLGRCFLPWAERVQRVGRGRGRKLRRRRCGTAGGAEWNEIEGQRSAKLGERAESRQGLPTLGCAVELPKPKSIRNRRSPRCGTSRVVRNHHFVLLGEEKKEEKKREKIGFTGQYHAKTYQCDNTYRSPSIPRYLLEQLKSIELAFLQTV